MSTNQIDKNGWTLDHISNWNVKTYELTGTPSSTGFETAKILLSKGAKVMMLNRNPKKPKNTIAT